jgi:hypothetical protein
VKVVIIRFPSRADFRKVPHPMASKLSLWQRLFRKPRKVSVAKMKIDMARKKA